MKKYSLMHSNVWKWLHIKVTAAFIGQPTCNTPGFTYSNHIALFGLISLCENDHTYSFLVGKCMLSKLFCGRHRKVAVPTLNDMNYFLSYFSSWNPIFTTNVSCIKKWYLKPKYDSVKIVNHLKMRKNPLLTEKFSWLFFLKLYFLSTVFPGCHDYNLHIQLLSLDSSSPLH